MTSALTRQFEDATERGTDIAGHLDHLRNLALELNAAQILELGTRGGESTSAWLAAIEQTGGRLDTVDLSPKPDLAGHYRWTHWESDDLDAYLVAMLWARAPIDVLFIDTSHEYWRTRAELAIYAPLVRAGGVIAMHDTALEVAVGYADPSPFPVRAALGDWLRDTTIPIASVLHAEHDFGLATIEVGR